MNLSLLKKLFAENGCQRIYVKSLSANDNSKNQVYLGSGFEILNILPIGEIKNESPGSWSKERFKASLNFSWIAETGTIYPAPQSQLILYPKYPEVRFSGFLAKCENAPSQLMTQRLTNRLFFFGVTKQGTVIGYVSHPDDSISKEFNATTKDNDHGIFKIIELPQAQNNREKLLFELKRIHDLGWIKSKRLNASGNIVSCESSNCGGYTLEAEMGITPNGYSEPDFLGWELKQFGVRDFAKINSSIITLMTPEPTGGFYVTEGVESFVRKYGYADKSGKSDRQDRLNFGGIHKSNKLAATGLELQLLGYDVEQNKIRSTDGRIALIDKHNEEAASWSFSSLIKHWNRKHNQACYVPSISDILFERKYQYGDKVILGSGTDFQLFLTEMAKGHIYYDPGIKVEHISTKPKAKRRSQFRIKSQHLSNLYRDNEIVDLNNNL